jgi:tRNA A37 threonylcarbamoyladenosine dehydratase
VREVSDEIYREQFTRNSKFFGEEGQARVEGSFVVVVGLGGVGVSRYAMSLFMTCPRELLASTTMTC